MSKNRADSLHELADLIHALARHLPAPGGLRPGPCTPLEISVVRFVGKNPGTFAGAAAKAARLPSSNFSRVANGLVAKGLLSRKADGADARNVRLYPTELAARNRDLMRDAWSTALAGTSADTDAIDALNATLGRIETELASRSQGRRLDDDASTTRTDATTRF